MDVLLGIIGWICHDAGGDEFPDDGLVLAEEDVAGTEGSLEGGKHESLRGSEVEVVFLGKTYVRKEGGDKCTL